jgi:uncharacterized membrane protein
VILPNYHATSVGSFVLFFLHGTSINILTIKTPNHTVLIMYNSIVIQSFHGRLWTEPEFKLFFFLLKAWITSSPFGEKKTFLVEAATKLV